MDLWQVELVDVEKSHLGEEVIPEHAWVFPSKQAAEAFKAAFEATMASRVPTWNSRNNYKLYLDELPQCTASVEEAFEEWWKPKGQLFAGASAEAAGKLPMVLPLGAPEVLAAATTANTRQDLPPQADPAEAAPAATASTPADAPLVKWVATYHSGGGSMGEAMQPEHAWGFATFEEASAFADYFMETLCAGLGSYQVMDEDLICVSELEGFVLATSGSKEELFEQWWKTYGEDSYGEEWADNLSPEDLAERQATQAAEEAEYAAKEKRAQGVYAQGAKLCPVCKKGGPNRETTRPDGLLQTSELCNHPPLWTLMVNEMALEEEEDRLGMNPDGTLIPGGLAALGGKATLPGVNIMQSGSLRQSLADRMKEDPFYQGR